MVLLGLYFLLFLFGLILPGAILIFALFAMWGDFKGAPYVPTSSKIIAEILEGANLKKGQMFYELGSGDGRVTRMAVKLYQVNGFGVDIHPMLVWYSRILSRWQGLKNISFKTGDLFKTDLREADVVFLFLLPKTLSMLQDKILRECSKKTLIIAHGFTISGMEKYLAHTQKRKLFPTYFYRIK